jgi:hypothetical protein
MSKDLQELKEQLDIWIERTNPELYDDIPQEYWKEMGSLTSLLIVREWVVTKLTNNK